MFVNGDKLVIKALIFDFNGVIVDDEPVHCEMFRQALAKEGIGLSKEDYYRHYLGMNDRECFTAVLTKVCQRPTAARIQKLVRCKARLYRAYIARYLIFFPGAKW